MKKRRKPVGVHPFIKQAVRAKWSSESMKGQIHALMGADKEKLLAYGSIMFFVASACGMYQGCSGDEPDMRIVRASVNALDDLAMRAEITDIDRGSILGGLQASARIIEATPIEVVSDAAILYDEQSREWERAKA
jgi:hypothetical protein